MNIEYSVAGKGSRIVPELSKHASHALQSVDWIKRYGRLGHYLQQLSFREEGDV